MVDPPDSDDAPIGRYELRRGTRRFARQLRRRPVSALLLALLLALLGAAQAFDWVPRSTQRVRWDAGIWALALSAWSLALWVAWQALRGWRERRAPDPGPRRRS